MDVLTQAYAHLDFNSKLASAEAMTWIQNTSLAQEKPMPTNPVNISVSAV